MIESTERAAPHTADQVRYDIPIPVGAAASPGPVH